MVDNYDSFTYTIVRYMEEAGENVEVIRNTDSLEEVDIGRFAGILLSPGPSTPENSGITLDVIRRHSGVPMLGVCLGMQALVHSFGGVVKRAGRIMHGKTDEIEHRGGDLFRGIPEKFRAVRYHSLAAEKDTMPECLEVMAESSDGEIMAVKHRSLYLWGVQFHPESYLTEHGRRLIENFIGGAHERNKG